MLKRGLYKGLSAVLDALESAAGRGMPKVQAGAIENFAMDRTAALLRGLDQAPMTGVEIGAFYSPLAPKAKGWRTTVVDFTDAQTLRKVAENHSNEHVRSLRGAIEDVDVVWRGQPLASACLERVPEGYDFLIASHVIEHLPDLLDFLQQASKLLKFTCVLSLAVPDMRRCFDAFQSPTNTTHILTAHREKRTQHTPQTLLEVWAYGCASNGVGGWAPTADLDLTFVESLGHVWNKYQTHLARAEDAEYVDAHAWRFTPSSFELSMLELNALDQMDFVVTGNEPGPCSEFIVRMERGSVSRSAPDLHAKRVALMLARQRELAEAFTQRAS